MPDLTWPTFWWRRSGFPGEVCFGFGDSRLLMGQRRREVRLVFLLEGGLVRFRLGLLGRARDALRAARFLEIGIICCRILLRQGRVRADCFVHGFGSFAFRLTLARFNELFSEGFGTILPSPETNLQTETVKIAAALEGELDREKEALQLLYQIRCLGTGTHPVCWYLDGREGLRRR